MVNRRPKLKFISNKFLLIILDGFGIRRSKHYNAIKTANPKFFYSLQKKYPNTQLHASGKFVGLPRGYIGNSEVGHLHIGSGRLVMQNMTRIENEIKNKVFFKNKIIAEVMAGTVHIMGLLSDAGVHSHIDHLFALLDFAKKKKIKKVFVHAFLDGRDTPPRLAKRYLAKLDEKMKSLNKDWQIATLSGRYFGMDRDTNWSRTKKAYFALTQAKGIHETNWKIALNNAYARGESDEFISPAILNNYDGIKKDDALIFFNFRADRAVQLTKLFTDKNFKPFKRIHTVVRYLAMTEYCKNVKASVAFPLIKLKNTLGETISKNNLRQFRLAETQKWAHVTFFFNGLSDSSFKKEDRLLIPSVKVATFDKAPKMSAEKIKREAMKRLKTNKYNFMLINFANPDMVGHTGKFKPAVKAIKTVDKCLSELVPFAQDLGYTILVTADHGNAEQMRYPNGDENTAHTTNKVPLVIITDKKLNLKTGSLFNIAPTVLKLMGLKIPKDMTKALF